jgi:uncharacterized protein
VTSPQKQKAAVLKATVIASLSLAFLLLLCARPYVEFLWLEAQGQSKVFWTLLWAQIVCFGVAAVAGSALTLASLAFASRGWPTYQLRMAGLDRKSFFRLVSTAAALTAGLLAGLQALPLAPKALVWLNQQAFERRDPLFGKDVGFYIYSLPFWEALLNVAYVVVLLSAVGPIIYYVGKVSQLPKERAIPDQVGRHTWIVAGALVVLRAFGFVLDRYNLAVSGSGPAAGAGYVDANVLSPSLLVMAAVCMTGGLVLIFYRKYSHPIRQIGILAGMLFLTIALLGFFPGMIQQYKVRPNEISLERPYIEHAISSTWDAFGFKDIQETDFQAAQTLTRSTLDEFQSTLENIRLWDPGPLKDSYQQLQSLRTYYRFHDVDIDRYTVDGTVRQVMLSAREIPMDQGHETWVNRHLQYTHGYGLAMNPVNEMTSEGQPRFWIRDLPPESVVDIPVERPEIYYGEETNWFVLGNTDEQELDYAKGDKNVYCHYQGEGGVQVQGWGRRLTLALYFRDLNLLLSSAINPESRAMFHRNIIERVKTLAPFLKTDDPYLVVSNGNLFWIMDLYTETDRYPYSHSFESTNYLRNSVKAIINPYSGQVQMVVVDTSDPLLKTYRKIYPTLFTDLADIDQDIRKHFRYPENLLAIQAQVYNTYHMTDPQVFYNKEDQWEFAKENYHGKEQEVLPYYMVMRLPGETEPEFILMLPVTPKDKDNMIAWVAARCDGENYGKLLLFRFPKDRLVYGPRQIEARIDQDTVISQQLTLWEQKGSQVLRGKFLVIPVEDSLLYVEPLYIQATAARMPELKRVIVTSSNPDNEQERSSIVMERTLDAALLSAFGDGAKPVADVKPPPVESTENGTTSTPPPASASEPSGAGEVARQALEHMARAQKALDVYHQEMAKAKALLETLTPKDADEADQEP